LKIKITHIIFIIFIFLKISILIVVNYINGENISVINSSKILLRSNNFISKDYILKVLNASKLIGDSVKVKSVDLKKIESRILLIPYVDKVSSFIDIESNLFINISEKNPVIDLKDYDFFLSNKGKLIPKNDSVKINIKSYFGKIDPKAYFELAHLGEYIINNDFFNNHIKYFYFDSSSYYFKVNEFDYEVKFGDLKKLKNKLKKYKGFYASRINKDVLKNFSKLDLNFNNQVIATKK
tara:strand:+ start:9096 stop:9809 length:714 start_codon:yes stop_codon:yes gene_type:complete